MRCWSIALLFAAPLFAQEPEEAAYFVSGIVKEHRGKPVSAAVYLFDALAADRPLAQGRANERGQFRIVVSRTAAARRDHPFGSVRLVVHEPGLAREEREVRAGASGIEITLYKPSLVAGVVTNPAGEPLPGAPVVARQGLIRLATTTDEQGKFEFEDLRGRVKVTADATGYRAMTNGKWGQFVLKPLPLVKGRVLDATSKRPLAGVYLSVLDSDVHAESDAEGGFAIELDGGKGAIAAYLDGYAISRFEFDGGDLVLRPAESVRGTVLNEKREPVPFAPVRLESGFGAPQFARTDAAGAFEFAIGVSGFAFVHVERRGYLPARVTVDPGWRPDRVRVVLSRGRAVRGSVLRGGKPVMGACVTAWRVLGTGEREEVARAYTDGGGNAALLAVPADAGVLTAHADGDRSGELPIAESMSFVLTADPPIRGRVVDDTGKPLQKLIVSLSRNKLGRHVSTDAQGKFEFTGLEPGRYRIGFGNAVGYVNVRRSVVRGQLVELVAERVLGTRTLTVEVMPARAHLSRVVLEGDGWRRVRWLRPGEDGGQFRKLAPGEYRVRVESPGFQDVSAVAEVYGDHRASIARIRLARAGTLRLKATPGAAVVVQTLEGEPAPSVTLKLEDGSLELAGFGPGRYRFLSRAPGEIIVVEEIEVGEKDPPRDLDLSGGPASTLKITVTDSARNPVRGVSIDLLTEGGLRFPTGVMTDANGVAALARLIRGRLVIVAQKGDLRVEKAIAIGSGAAHEAALVLE